jgi:hypothetical protein
MNLGGSMAVTRTIKVAIMQHRDTGLLIATSDDLPGLFLAGRTEKAIGDQLPDAVRTLLEADGSNVLSLTTGRDSTGLPPAFSTHNFIASAQVEARAA